MSTAIERAGAAADERLDAGGRCVIPGFVDSHTHLVFAGDRADEFAARMAGRPYAASGIRVTTEATRAASEDELRDARRAPGAARRSRAGITHIEIKSGYGLESEAERRCCAVAARAHRRRDLPRRARGAARVRGPRGRVRRARLRRDARGVRAARPLDRRVLRGGRVRRRPVARGARGRPRRRPRPARARQPARLRARACSSRSRWARRRSTTAPTWPTRTSRRSPASDTVATFLPATDFSTRQPYPDARRAIDAGVHGRDRDQLQPGLELHDLDGVLHRARRPRHAHDARGGAARRRRAAAPARCSATTSGGSCRERGRTR